MAEVFELTLEEQLRRRRELLDNPESAEETKPTKPKPKPEKKEKPKEKVGTGRDLRSETTKALLKQIDARIAAAQAGNNAEMVKKLKEQRKRLLEGG